MCASHITVIPTSAAGADYDCWVDRSLAIRTRKTAHISSTNQSAPWMVSAAYCKNDNHAIYYVRNLTLTRSVIKHLTLRRARTAFRASYSDLVELTISGLSLISGRPRPNSSTRTTVALTDSDGNVLYNWAHYYSRRLVAIQTIPRWRHFRRRRHSKRQAWT